jgi:hypothetical protein
MAVRSPARPGQAPSSQSRGAGSPPGGQPGPQSLAEVVADAAGQFVVALIELNDMPPRVCRWLRNPS